MKLLGETVAWLSATPESCYAVAAAAYMPAGQGYLMPQTPQLLLQYAYWLSAAARWMLAGSLPLNSAC